MLGREPPARVQAGGKGGKSCADQARGNLRDIGDQQQHQHSRRDQGQARLGHVLHTDTVTGDTQTGSDEQVRADRRRELADGQVDRADHAEVNGVNAELPRDRIHDGNEDVHIGVRIHKAAGDQQHDVDDDQEAALAAVLQQGLDTGRDAIARAGVGEDRRAADNEHQSAGALGRIIKKLHDVLPLQLLIDDGTDKQSVHRSHGRRLRSGENAAIDASQNDDGHQQPPEGALEGAPHLAPALPGMGGLQVVLVGIDLHHDDHGDAHDDAGENTGHKDVAHRNAGEGRIDHKRNAGRDNDRNRGSGSHHAMCEGGREFLTLDHSGDQDDAQSCHGGRARAGDGAEEAGHNDADHCDAAAQVS